MKPSLARVWAPALVFGAALALLATPLWVGALPLDNDALYADVARTMLRSGDFLNPSIHGVPFLDKPPAFFWLLAAAQQLLGSSVFVLRLPAAISGALIATLVYLAAAAPRTRAVAITASLLLLGMPLFVEYSRRVYMETPVAACVLFALLCFDRGFRNARDGRRAWPSYAAAGALVGAGFMF
jgi:4-amino-4-deoxy-L-arabinose transferase-like glycosyltransferase